MYKFPCLITWSSRIDLSQNQHGLILILMKYLWTWPDQKSILEWVTPLTVPPFLLLPIALPIIIDFFPLHSGPGPSSSVPFLAAPIPMIWFVKTSAIYSTKLSHPLFSKSSCIRSNIPWSFSTRKCLSFPAQSRNYEQNVHMSVPISSLHSCPIHSAI